ncbi:hypothetical protein [Streptomyces alfalfae]|uniref:Uncharacterized protein n=1 Tax=Streptomyces alfalfae TaxID=1642299 RepID=A0A7T4TZF0_9ACTN|nr:hypothetical protein [Streptomyces alfalfae]QQC91155.1 hypothetical protein I8755_24165 [Streptomyces alfalfae]
MTDSTENTATTDPADALKHAMIEQLMGIIGAPDDQGVADAADAVVRELDALLRAEPEPAA